MEQMIATLVGMDHGVDMNGEGGQQRGDGDGSMVMTENPMGETREVVRGKHALAAI
jgi:hypothetical protein